jgi:hypothetical protein
MSEIRLGRRLKKRKTPKISGDAATPRELAYRRELSREIVALSLQLILNR